MVQPALVWLPACDAFCHALEEQGRVPLPFLEKGLVVQQEEQVFLLFGKGPLPCFSEEAGVALAGASRAGGQLGRLGPGWLLHEGTGEIFVHNFILPGQKTL